MAILDEVHGVSVGRLETYLELRIVEPVCRQNILRHHFSGVSFRLDHNRFALEVGNRVDLCVSTNHHLEVLRIKARDMTDLRQFPRIGRPARKSIDRGNRIAKADLRFVFVHAAYVGDACAGYCSDLQAGNRLFPHAFQRAPERDPDPTLRTGHESQLLRGRRSRHRKQKNEQQAQEESTLHRILPSFNIEV
jgi:hypothetical protein